MAEEKIKGAGVEQPKETEPKEALAIEKIPEKILEKINKLKADKSKYINTMLRISIQETQLRLQQEDIVKSLGSNNNALIDCLNRASKKLRLKDKQQYRWQFNGKDAFVGIKIKTDKK